MTAMAIASLWNVASSGNNLRTLLERAAPPACMHLRAAELVLGLAIHEHSLGGIETPWIGFPRCAAGLFQ